MVSPALVLLAVVGSLAPAQRHPTHTSSAELVQEAGGATRVVIRVFADDIREVTGVAPGSSPSPAALGAYLRERFGIRDRSGRPVALEWAGAELVGDIVAVRLRATVAGGLSGAMVTNRVLTERFADQVNVVRAQYDRRAATLIFTRGDGSKALP